MKNLFSLLILSSFLTVSAGADALQGLASYTYGEEGDRLWKAADAVLASAPADQNPELEKKLLAVLSEENVTPEARMAVCRLLQRIGSDACIPALIPLLQDEQLAAYARGVLEHLPDTSRTNRALREALVDAPDSVKPGLLSLLGERSDKEAVKPMMKLARHENPEVAAAALLALGKVGNRDAAEALEELEVPKELAQDRWQAMVTCGRQLGGKKGSALLNQVIATPGGDQRTAALIALAAVDSGIALPLVEDILKTGTKAEAKGLLHFVASKADSATISALAATLPDLPDERKAALLTALGARGEAAARNAAEQYIADENEAVARAAIYAAGQLGNSATLKKLLALEDVETIIGAVSRMNHPDIDSTLIAALDNPALRLPALHLLVARDVFAAAPRLVSLLSEQDETVVREAWTALQTLGGSEEVGGIMQALIAEEDPALRSLAQKTLRQVIAGLADKQEPFAKVAGYYSRSDKDMQRIILHLASAAGSEEALALCREALAGPDADLSKTALAALSQWPNEKGAKDLLSLAESAADESTRRKAVTGYIRLAGLPEAQLNSQQRMIMFKSAEKIIGDTATKQQILSVLQKMRDKFAFDLIVSYLDDPEVARDAEAAAANVLRQHHRRHREEVTSVADRLIQSDTKWIRQKAKPFASKPEPKPEPKPPIPAPAN